MTKIPSSELVTSFETSSNKKVFYALMFKAVSATLLELGADPKYLGGTVGVIAMLHTWTQTLNFHPHIHCIVPSGALASDGLEWISGRKEFLFPAKVLKKLYRGKMMTLFRDALERGDIVTGLPKSSKQMPLGQLIDSLYKTEWVVYIKKSFSTPKEIVRYLGAYINRIAISNKRIVSITEDNVTFSYKDREDNNRQKLMTISIVAFIERFFLHSVPVGFVRIRYYGLLANRNRSTTMARCRTAVSGVPETAIDEEETDISGNELLPQNQDESVGYLRCPCCGSNHLTLTKEIPKRRIVEEKRRTA